MGKKNFITTEKEQGAREVAEKNVDEAVQEIWGKSVCKYYGGEWCKLRNPKQDPKMRSGYIQPEEREKCLKDPSDCPDLRLMRNNELREKKRDVAIELLSSVRG